MKPKRVVVWMGVLGCIALLAAGIEARHSQNEGDQNAIEDVVKGFFAAHSQGETATIEAMYWPGATVSIRMPGADGKPQVMTQPVKQYVGWFAGQFAAREAMDFRVMETAVRSQGPLADSWVKLEVHEKMKDGSSKVVRAVASFQLFRGAEGWKISAHAWQATG